MSVRKSTASENITHAMVTRRSPQPLGGFGFSKWWAPFITLIARALSTMSNLNQASPSATKSATRPQPSEREGDTAPLRTLVGIAARMFRSPRASGIVARPTTAGQGVWICGGWKAGDTTSLSPNFDTPHGASRLAKGWPYRRPHGRLSR